VQSRSCAKCGALLASHRRKAGHRELCTSCAPRPDDPLNALVAEICVRHVVNDDETLVASIARTLYFPHQQSHALVELQSSPRLLSDGFPHRDQYTVRLAETLVSLEIAGVAAPLCPFCKEVRPLRFRRNNLRVCRSCYDMARLQPCGDCGKPSQPAGRTADQRPQCTMCSRKDPRNFKQCSFCGELRHPYRHVDGAPLCRRCSRGEIATCTTCFQRKVCHNAGSAEATCENCSRNHRRQLCDSCERLRPVSSRTSDGNPLCADCARKRAPCVSCHRVKPVHGRSSLGPLCKSCYAKDPSSFQDCTNCGRHERLFHYGLCAGCASKNLLLKLLDTSKPSDTPVARLIYDSLVASEPRALLDWMASSSTALPVVKELAAGNHSLSHETLDTYLPDRAIAHLRQILVASGALPDRDEQLAAFQRWVESITAETEPDTPTRQIVQGYARWFALRQLRAQSYHRKISVGQWHSYRTKIEMFQHLSRALRERKPSLTDASQRDLDLVLSGESGRKLVSARQVVQWAVTHRYLHGLEIERPQPASVRKATPDDTRWSTVRRLMHDHDIPQETRAAGLLLLLYGQPLHKIVPLSRTDLETRDGRVYLRLGKEPVELPKPIDELVLSLAAKPRGRAAIGQHDSHSWLFPGGRPGQHLMASSLAAKLRVVGVEPRLDRNSAMLELASKLAPVVVSKLLGLSLEAAVRWSHIAGTDAEYAAEVSRR
jgi:hypothetical protein